MPIIPLLRVVIMLASIGGDRLYCEMGGSSTNYDRRKRGRFMWYKGRVISFACDGRSRYPDELKIQPSNPDSHAAKSYENLSIFKPSRCDMLVLENRPTAAAMVSMTRSCRYIPSSVNDSTICKAPSCRYHNKHASGWSYSFNSQSHSLCDITIIPHVPHVPQKVEYARPDLRLQEANHRWPRFESSCSFPLS